MTILIYSLTLSPRQLFCSFLFFCFVLSHWHILQLFRYVRRPATDTESGANLTSEQTKEKEEKASAILCVCVWHATKYLWGCKLCDKKRKYFWHCVYVCVRARHPLHVYTHIERYMSV